MQSTDSHHSTLNDYVPTSATHYAISDRIKNFAPSWFAVNMGTGAVSVLFQIFPYGSQPVLQAFGAAFLILNIIIFVVFLVFAILRYVKHPEIFRLMYEHPVQSLYMGCCPMGFATIINASLKINQVYGIGGESLLHWLWGLWWFDAMVSLMLYFHLLYTMITRHNHSIQALTAAWLLPTVTPIVPSTTGALLADALLPHSAHSATVTLFMATVMLFLGLGLTFMILPLYTLRLITVGLPPNTLITTKFLPVGPCGQAGTAFIIIGQVLAKLAERGVSQNMLLRDAQPLALIGFCAGFFLWTFGVWWFALSVVAIAETFVTNRPQFAVGFWGMVFPLGVYSLLTVYISEVLDSAFFRVVASIFTLLVFMLWGTLAIMTVYDLSEHREELLNASCLPDSGTNRDKAK
ncbi:Sulfite efflux pump SSU1 [Ceratobasidium theobromae]|uniref:Sulfite efflux pump SSU1 n=1 Tax=Ceratobasidium theobromae TaxID=1582974 RepID=A0A5N5QDG3_9AGAM|nr:Sulfite efflux pump SSU1 [Ceratobasidium theobromae]